MVGLVYSRADLGMGLCVCNSVMENVKIGAMGRVPPAARLALGKDRMRPEQTRSVPPRQGASMKQLYTMVHPDEYLRLECLKLAVEYSKDPRWRADPTRSVVQNLQDFADSLLRYVH